MKGELQLSVVDIGGARYFDARRIPVDAVVDASVVEAATRACVDAPESPALYVWILPRGLEMYLPKLSPAAIAVFFGSLGDPGRGCAPGSLLPDLSRPPRSVARTMAYVDGWAADPTSIAFARAAGLELLLDWPRVIDSTATTNVRDFLDRALPPSSPGG
ncbi:MAG: hypothetical protein U0414_14500 [Polyangiaceae bacterium]